MDFPATCVLFPKRIGNLSDGAVLLLAKRSGFVVARDHVVVHVLVRRSALLLCTEIILLARAQNTDIWAMKIFVAKVSSLGRGFMRISRSALEMTAIKLPSEITIKFAHSHCGLNEW